jgi:hypothetical protein
MGSSENTPPARRTGADFHIHGRPASPAMGVSLGKRRRWKRVAATTRHLTVWCCIALHFVAFRLPASGWQHFWPNKPNDAKPIISIWLVRFPHWMAGQRPSDIGISTSDYIVLHGVTFWNTQAGGLVEQQIPLQILT